jgi:hypothetical protein
LPFVGWRTRQSDASPDMNSISPVRDLFPFLTKPTVGSSDSLAHRTLSGGHRTVRCDYLTFGSATCHPLIAQTTVGHGCLWLTGQSGAPPNSPVNFIRDAFFISQERRVRRQASLGTGQSGAPQAGAGLADYSQFFSVFSSFLGHSSST